MSDDVVITVRNLRKIYKLYEKPIDRLKEAMNPTRKKYHNDFFALKNISFEIKRGETVGIIGKNGSGKSTLLKILTGVLTPTDGEIEVKGKVSALLELGAGFNPEFSGMENIYLNGTMMGYSHEEMLIRIPAIIEFADIGEFINQPVKTYSSGMFVRLAFAVAINVDPDILIVDEALAVGDDLFQRKCFNKIDSLRKSGKTIIFVSHSGGLIIEFCSRAILLDAGELVYSGKSERAVNLYQKMLFAPKEKVGLIRSQIERIFELEKQNHGYVDKLRENDEFINVKSVEKPCVDEVLNINDVDDEEYYDSSLAQTNPIYYESRGAKIFDYKILNYKGDSVNVLRFGKRYTLTYTVNFTQVCSNVRFGMLIKTKTGIEISGAGTALAGEGIPFVRNGQTLCIEFQFTPKLEEGVYFLRCGVVGIEKEQEIFFDRQIDAFAFRMLKKQNSLMNALVDFDITSSVYDAVEADLEV